MGTMKWIASVVCLASTFALVVGCEGDDSSSPGSYGGYSSCSYYTTCGSCTPVSGCGWCQAADGTGTCASGPDQCPGTAFNWTWNSSGCQSTGAYDAGGGQFDAGTYYRWDASASDATSFDSALSAEAASGDATSTDAATDPGDATSSADGGADAASSGCTNAPSLACTSSTPNGVVCTTADPFDAALAEPPPENGCSLLLVPTPVGTAYFCCAQPLSVGSGPR